jgi:hypothetical protein
MDEIDDRIAASVFRRLVAHLRHRQDVQNIDLMGVAGFCRNCLADWISEASAEAGEPLSRDEARRAIYGMQYTEWKKAQPEATAEQLARMAESVSRNRKN